ncbi:MAG: tRNA (N6-threonylcarbamoyladenosine(37)-N6)-methyltransferase TrmO [Hyphomicrobiaceae bacterium]
MAEQERVLRPGEVSVELPDATDAGLYFIGRIRTPYRSPQDCPRNRLAAGEAEAVIELDPRFEPALRGIELFSHLHVLYWMDMARRDILVQMPRHLSAPRGTFALRSPVRPNPIAMTVVKLKAVTGSSVRVSAIECRDGTPLLDLKPYYASTDSVPDARRP